MAIHIRNWKTFQGYEKRGPPWIKLHVGLLDDPDWIALPTVAKAILPPIWIAYSKQGGDKGLPEDVKVLSVLTHMPESDLSKGLPALKFFRFIECDGFVATPATEVSRPMRQKCRESREETEESREETEENLRPSAAESPAVQKLPSARAADVYRRHYPDGEVPGAMLAVLKPLFHKHGWDPLEVELDAYLQQTEKQYESWPKFASGFGTWARGRATRTGLIDVQKAGSEKARGILEALERGVPGGDAEAGRLLPQPSTERG